MKRIMPPTYLWIFLLLAIVLHFVFPIKMLVSSWHKYYIGALIFLFGLVVNIWVDQVFKKKGTTIRPDEIPTHFEISGAFKFSRHPIYLGMVLVLLGVAVMLGSLVAVIFPVIFFILMETIFIPIEEKNMEKAFGSKYLEYKKKVRRWL